MDLTIHIALYKSCFVSSTLSCTYENIDIPALYLRCFVSLTCPYENIDTSQFYVARYQLKTSTSRLSQLKNAITSGLPHIPFLHHQRFFLPSRFYSLAITDTPETSRSHERFFNIENVVRFRGTFIFDDSLLRCFSSIDPIAVPRIRNFLREDRNLSIGINIRRRQLSKRNSFENSCQQFDR